MTVSITPHIVSDINHLIQEITLELTSVAGSPIIDDTDGYWIAPDSDNMAEVIDMFGLAHVTTSASVGQLEDSSHKADGSAFFGAGNPTSNYLKLFDHTSNIEFGLNTHYRTGDNVTPVNDGHGNYTATMDAGLQNGQHNEQGANATHSAASFDISMNFGNGTPHAGEFKLVIDSSAGGHEVLTLEHTSDTVTVTTPVSPFFGKNGNPITTTTTTTVPVQWFLADEQGNPVLSLTQSPDGHVLQDSMNLAFLSNVLAHGANPADISPQDVHVSLIEMDGLSHTVGVAAVSETIHLVGHIA